MRSASLDRLFSFIHVLTGRLTAAGYLGVATLDSTAHEAASVNAVTAQFDGVIDIEESGDGRRIRARGFPGVARDWAPY